MSDLQDNKTEKSGFGIVQRVVFPTALYFTLILFVSYLIFFLLDFNVTETTDFVTYTYNGHTDTGTYEYKVGREFSFDLIQLFGFVLFSASVAALSYVKKLEVGTLIARLIHFTGSMLAFFIFILLLSGTVTSVGFGTAMGVTLAAAIIYFILLGIKTLCKRFVRIPRNSFTEYLNKQLPRILVVFTVIVLVAMLLAMFVNVQLMLDKEGPNYPDDDRIAITTYRTVITPIAPTLQNYLRYLGTAAVLVLSLSVMSTPLNAALKILITFVSNAASLAVLFIVQLDFFRDLDNATFYAVIGYCAVYLISLITFATVRFIRKRSREEDEDYENQFMRAGKKRN